MRPKERDKTVMKMIGNPEVRKVLENDWKTQ
jgi:hypothetical protein